MRLSIIVPVYGVEKYVIDFAESLFKQLTPEVELIIIDDGCKDNSIIILKEYISQNRIDSYIKFYHQENQGQSVARNLGISVCEGKYVTFLDPDDYVENGYIDSILNNITNFHDIDLYQFNAYIFKKNEVVGNLILAEDDYQYKLNNYNLIKIFKKQMWFSWLRVIKKDLLNNEFFPVGVNFQDMMAFPQLYKNVKTIKNINLNLVYYRIHENSSVHKFSDKLLKSIDYGLSLYKDKHSNSDKIVFRQFLKIRLMLSFQNLGLINTISWYRNYINRSDRNFIILNYTFFYSFIKKIYQMVR